MAVYPETTVGFILKANAKLRIVCPLTKPISRRRSQAFYKGTVSSVPRKHGGGGTNFVMISFMDDHDENGITHDKAVSTQHIFMVPQ